MSKTKLQKIVELYFIFSSVELPRAEVDDAIRMLEDIVIWLKTKR